MPFRKANGLARAYYKLKKLIPNDHGMVSTPPHSTTLQALKMSAIQMIIANIQSLNEADRAQVLGHFNKSAPLASNAQPKEAGATKDLEKKQNANKGRATCYADFAKKVMDEQKDAITAFKLANPELKGAHLSFVGTYKKDHAEEFATFEAAWKLAHPKEEAAPKPEVVAENAEPVDAKLSKRRVMSDEQKAKMKAGRELAKAKKYAEKVTQLPISPAFGAPMVDPVAEPVAEPVSLKKRGPKRLDSMTPEELAKHNAKKAERQAKKALGAAMDKAAGRPTVDTDTGSELSAISVPSARSGSPKLKDE